MEAGESPRQPDFAKPGVPQWMAGLCHGRERVQFAGLACLEIPLAGRPSLWFIPARPEKELAAVAQG